MKIIKLPKEIDPNLLIEKQVSEKYGICPFCGENRKYDPKEEIKYLRQGSAKGIYGIKITTINTRYGKQRPIWKHLFGEKYKWKYFEFTCETCGTIWQSDEYPEIDIRDIGIEVKEN